MKFSKDKCKVLHLRRENPLPSYRLVSDGSEEKALMVLADSKLNRIQQLPGSKESHQPPQLYNRSRATGLREVIILNLFNKYFQTTCKILHPVLTLRYKQSAINGSSVDSHHGGWRLGHLPCEESLRELVLLSPEKRGLWGRPRRLTAACKKVIKRMEPDPSQQQCRKTKFDGHKLKCQWLGQEIRRNFFPHEAR